MKNKDFTKYYLKRKDIEQFNKIFGTKISNFAHKNLIVVFNKDKGLTHLCNGFCEGCTSMDYAHYECNWKKITPIKFDLRKEKLKRIISNF